MKSLDADWPEFPDGADPFWQLPLIDSTTWFGHGPPPRRYIVDEWLIRGTGALLVGEDGIGKSLLAQQLATCVAAGKPFLGLKTEQVSALYISCEDDEEELWRRQRAINAAIGLPLDAAPAGLSSLVGHLDVDLGAFDDKHRFKVSRVYNAIVETARTRGTGLIILDNVSHFFTGNEIVRREVASFCAAVDRMAKQTDAAVLFLAHPNKSGAEYSGSTGWSAHVRQRWFLDRPDVDGVALDRDTRILRKSKANYSQSGVEIDFRWHDWAFVRPDDMPKESRDSINARVADITDNGLLLACLAERTKQRRAVSEKRSTTYAPSEFAKMAESKGIGKRRLEAAMDRLFRIGSIERGELWKGDDRHPVFGLRVTRVTVEGNSLKPPEILAGDCAGDSMRVTRETIPETAEILAGDAGGTLSIPKGITGAPLQGSAPVKKASDAEPARPDATAFEMAGTFSQLPDPIEAYCGAGR